MPPGAGAGLRLSQTKPWTRSADTFESSSCDPATGSPRRRRDRVVRLELCRRRLASSTSDPGYGSVGMIAAWSLPGASFVTVEGRRKASRWRVARPATTGSFSLRHTDPATSATRASSTPARRSISPRQRRIFPVAPVSKAKHHRSRLPIRAARDIATTRGSRRSTWARAACSPACFTEDHARPRARRPRRGLARHVRRRPVVQRRRAAVGWPVRDGADGGPSGTPYGETWVEPAWYPHHRRRIHPSTPP